MKTMYHVLVKILGFLLLGVSFVVTQSQAKVHNPPCIKSGLEVKNARKLIAVPARNKKEGDEKNAVFLSWRFLKSDSATTRFNVYRVQGESIAKKLTKTPIFTASNFVDSKACRNKKKCSDVRWLVETISENGPADCSISSAALSNGEGNVFSFPYERGAYGRSVSIGSLISGTDDYFVVRLPDVTVDPYFKLWRKIDERFELQAVDVNGKPRWTYDMGAAIEPGIWYSPYLVYDLDGDGSSELIVKAGEAGVEKKDLVDEAGRVTQGRELLKIVSGKDGKTVLAQAPWPDRSGFIGDVFKRHEDYNRYSRNLMAIAYLDGKNPHVVVVRGTYGKHKVQAFLYQQAAGLSLVWSWENQRPSRGANGRNDKKNAMLSKLWGQGAHTIRTGDIDADGKDEVIIGSIALDDNGKPLWSIDRGHVDHIHLGDLVPSEPGLEMYFGSERHHGSGGMGMVKADSGEFLWRYHGKTKHIHKEGVCANLFASSPGLECYSGEADQSGFWLWSNEGKPLSRNRLDSLSPLVAYWGDGDKKWYLKPLEKTKAGKFLEIIDLETGEFTDQVNLPKDVAQKDLNSSTVLAVADIFGDWREEIIVAARGRILVYTSNHPSSRRLPWLMSDHIYAMGATLSSMGYYQQPILGELKLGSDEALVAH